MARTCVCVRPVIVPMTISFSADGNYFSLHDKNKQIFYMTRHSISRHSQLHSSAQHYVPPICRRLIIFDRLLTLTLNFLHFWSARFLLHISKLQDNRRRNKKKLSQKWTGVLFIFACKSLIFFHDFSDEPLNHHRIWNQVISFF